MVVDAWQEYQEEGRKIGEKDQGKLRVSRNKIVRKKRMEDESPEGMCSKEKANEMEIEEVSDTEVSFFPVPET